MGQIVSYLESKNAKSWVGNACLCVKSFQMNREYKLKMQHAVLGSSDVDSSVDYNERDNEGSVCIMSFIKQPY